MDSISDVGVVCFLFFILFLLILNQSLRLKNRIQGVEKRLDDIEKYLDSGLNGLRPYVTLSVWGHSE